MKTKRLISLLLAIVMLAFALTACSSSPQAIIEKADKALANTPYKLDISVEFDGDENYLEMISAADIKSTIYMDGTNFESKLDIMGITATLTHADGVAYLGMSFLGFPIKTKAEVNSSEIDELLKYASVSDLGALDFDSLAIEKKGDAGLIVKCTNIKADKLTEFSKEFGADNFTIDNVNLDATIVDGRYENITISMVYKYSESGRTVDIDAKMTMDFDYENAKEITAPADKDQYSIVDFDNLFNLG